MRKMNKLIILLLAMVMVLAMGVTALAANDYTITITYSESGHTYEAYQIFSGDLAYSEYTGTAAPTDGTQLYTYDGSTYTAADYTDGGTFYYVSSLTNIEWGSGVNGTALLAALQNDADYGSLFTSCNSASEVAAVLSKNNSNTALAKQFAKLANNNLTTTVAGTSSEGTSKNSDGDYVYTISDLSAGYYLVKDRDTSVDGKELDAYTDIILEVVDNVTVKSKAEVPSSSKTVDDINDSTETTVTTGTSADHDIGDDVTFTLSATLPTNYASYSTYKLIFHDVMSSGLTFNSSSVVVTVYADSTDTTGTKVALGYTVVTDTNCYHKVSITSFDANTTYYTYDNTTYTEVTDTSGTPDGNTTYYVKCTFTVQIADTNTLCDESGSKITVTANSIITVTYTAKLNDNAVVGNYGNPNTMHIEYSNNPNGDGTGVTPDDTVVVFTYKLVVNKVDSSTQPLKGAGFTLYKYDADTQTYVAVGSEVTGTDMTTFTWTGLDDGKYKLVETKTPSGYNTMEDLYFTIVATHDENGITSLMVTDVHDESGNTVTGLTATLSTGTISTDITNHKGSELPSTGGIGTTIFYIVGAILVFGAAVILITRKRMSRAE